MNCSIHIVRISVFSVPMDKPDFPMVQRMRSFLIPLQFCVYHLPLFDGTHNLEFANIFDFAFVGSLRCVSVSGRDLTVYALFGSTCS